MRLKNYLSLVLCLATFCGCHYDIFSRRRSELCCPTDIRQKHRFSWGEDAVFHAPCGPDAEFYGLKSTSWRVWPESGAPWRDADGAVITEAETWVDGESVLVDHVPQPEAIEAPNPFNPFRDDPQALPESKGIGPPLTPPGSSQIEQTSWRGWPASGAQWRDGPPLTPPGSSQIRRSSWRGWPASGAQWRDRPPLTLLGSSQIEQTSWRVWPTSDAQWRDADAPVITEAETWVDGGSFMIERLPPPEAIEVPDPSHPFRDDPQALPELKGIGPRLTRLSSSQIQQSFYSRFGTLPEPDHEHQQGQLFDRRQGEVEDWRALPRWDFTR